MSVFSQLANREGLDRKPCQDLVQRISSEDSLMHRRSLQQLDCPHKSRKHYAKNMCINCYHRKGRTKKAWACAHREALHYSKGLCQNCYLSRYYR